MNLEEFKARIAPIEGPTWKRASAPFSRHDAGCCLRETGRPGPTCERCKAKKRRKANRKKNKRAEAKRAAEDSVFHYRDREPRKSDSVFAVSGGLPSLGRGSR